MSPALTADLDSLHFCRATPESRLVETRPLPSTVRIALRSTAAGRGIVLARAYGVKSRPFAFAAIAAISSQLPHAIAPVVPVPFLDGFVFGALLAGYLWFYQRVARFRLPDAKLALLRSLAPWSEQRVRLQLGCSCGTEKASAR